MQCARFTKDPDATLDYGIDWTNWLETGDSIASSAWEVPTGLTLTSQSNTNNKTLVWLSGGTVGTTYTVRNRITTASTPPRVEDRSILIQVINR